MDRRQSLYSLLGLSMLSFGRDVAAADAGKPAMLKSKTEWAKLLPPAAYNVLFEEGTERAGSSFNTLRKPLLRQFILKS